MKKENLIKVLAFILAFSVVSSLAGCGSNTEQNLPSDSELVSNTLTESAETDSKDSSESVVPSEETESQDITETETSDATEKVDEVESVQTEEERLRAEEEARRKEEEAARLKAEEEKKLAEQRNSFSMMYYLAITAEEIRTSKDNRLALEDIYTSLLNDINPGAVDEITQNHLKNLRDIIKSYLNIASKRERLEVIYNQEKAAAIRKAVPDPLSILSVTNAMNWKKLVMSVLYTKVEACNNKKEAEESAEMSYIMSGWELDDKEKEAVMKNRERAFDYMVDMVQQYQLDGLKTLNEKSIEKYAEISATENASEKIKLLRAEESTYELLGIYWLQLADAYFETSQYTKCLECVERYTSLATGIYRQDFNYLRIIPKAIVAAQETYTGEKYVSTISEYADAIIANTSSDDWSSRYFAAQVYLDLYSKTNDSSYLEKAYKIASENVAVLLKYQRSINSTYLNDVVEQTVAEPDYRFMTDKEKKEAQKEYKEEQKRVKEYNKALQKTRKTELPSLYEPLVLNCELLFALADRMNIGNDEKAEVEAILQTDTNGIFIVKPINDAYSFSNTANIYSIELTKDEIIIPAFLLTDNSAITVSVTDNGVVTTFDDCVVNKVDRKGSTIDTFDVHISSKQLKKYKWTANSRVTITITYGDAYNKTTGINLVVSTFENHWYGDKVVFAVQ